MDDNKVTLYKALSKSRACEGEHSGDDALAGDDASSFFAVGDFELVLVVNLVGVEGDPAISSSCKGLATGLGWFDFDSPSLQVFAVEPFSDVAAAAGALFSFLEDDEAASLSCLALSDTGDDVS